MRSRRLLPLLLAVLMFAALPSAAAAGTPVRYPGNGSWQPGPKTYGTVVVKNVPVRLSDGTTLPANIGYPADLKTGTRAAGTFPVLVSQVPYLGADVPINHFAEHGYIYAAVAVRGTQNSSGPGGRQIANPFFGPGAGKDGVEVVDWAAHRLSGSNGVIGLAGCSFFGINQLFTAAELGPDSPVKAMIPACASFGYQFLIAGGMPSGGISALGTPNATVIFGPDNIVANNAYGAAISKEILAGGDRAYNRTYWQERDTDAAMAAKIARTGIPTLLWTGWNALDGSVVPQFWSALQNTWAGRPPGAPMTPGQPVTGKFQLIAGPGIHAQGLDLDLMLEWYDTWLKGAKTGVGDTKTPMHLNEQRYGEQQKNRWVNAGHYPIAQAGTVYRLGTGGSLGPAATTGSAELRYAAPDATGGTVRWTSKPFTADRTVAGNVAISLGATSTTRNASFIATLEDVAPDGTVTPISRGNIVGSLATVDEASSWRDAGGNLSLVNHPFDQDRYVPAGQWHRYDFSLTPTMYRVVQGHSVRLRLTSQSTGVDCISIVNYAAPCTLTAPQKASIPGGRYTISFGGDRASTVNLPLVDPASLATARSGQTPTSFAQTVPLEW